jgi:hypothetical protein
VNRKLEFLCRRIREKFLEFHFDGDRDLVEAANALGIGGRLDLGRHQNSVMKAFEANIHHDGCSLEDRGDSFAQTMWSGEFEVLFTVFTDALRHVKNIDVEGVRGRGLHS